MQDHSKTAGATATAKAKPKAAKAPAAGAAVDEAPRNVGGRPTKITPEKLMRIKQALRQGELSQTALAKSLELGKRTLVTCIENDRTVRAARDVGLRRLERERERKQAKAAQLHNQGVARGKIAEALGVTPATLRNWEKEAREKAATPASAAAAT
jgi:DNA-binding transcriptional regulator YiaG